MELGLFCMGGVSHRHAVVVSNLTKLFLPRLYVRFNEFNTSSADNCTTENDEVICREDYAVESIVPHPEYDMHNISRPNDICILRLASDVTFNDYVRPICLPFDPDVQQLPIVDEIFTVTGWGETEDRK